MNLMLLKISLVTFILSSVALANYWVFLDVNFEIKMLRKEIIKRTAKPAKKEYETMTAMKTIPKIKHQQIQMSALKLLGRRESLKQSTCTKLEISPSLKVLLQRTEYFIALLTIPIVTEFEI